MGPRIFLFLLLACGTSPALACRCVGLSPDRPDFARLVDAIVADAEIVAVGVIAEPNGPLLEPAFFRPTRVLKGPARPLYRIGLSDRGGAIGDCALTTRDAELGAGTPLLLALAGGPDVYTASRCANSQTAAYRAAVIARLAPRRRNRRVR